VLIDHSNGRVLEVLETREKSVVKAWLADNLASGLLAHVEEVTSDMWEGYTMAAREVFGSRVRIVIDRFHVMRQFQKKLNEARCQLQRTLPTAEAVEALKGTRWLWLTNDERLSEDQRRQLAKLKRQFPPLAALVAHRDQLRQIFEDRTIRTAAVGAIHLKDWCQRGRALGFKALEPFYRMLEHWLKPIANYFVTRASNGPTEGFNRGLRGLLWRACGMVNFQHLRLRVLHAFG
jgi:transposase